jgi:hypothetical protein
MKKCRGKNDAVSISMKKCRGKNDAVSLSMKKSEVTTMLFHYQ